MATSRTGTRRWKALRTRALAELPHVCAVCGTRLDPDALRYSNHAMELDHILPVKLGGTVTIDNVQWLCSPCNMTKGDRIPAKPRKTKKPVIASPIW